MKFQVGDKIRFRYTGAKGEIVQDFLDGSYKVYDPQDRDEIVAFEDDIVLESNFRGVEQSELSKKHGKPVKEKGLTTEEIFFGKAEVERLRKEEMMAALRQKNPQAQPPKTTLPVTPKAEQPEVKRLAIRPQDPSDQGLFLAMAQETAEGYVVYLINDTPNSFSFDFEIFKNQYSIHRLKHSITPYTFFAVGELRQLDVLESPNFDLRLPAMNFEKNIKIKPKKLLEQQREAPLMGAELLLFPVFEGKNPPSATQDLKNYTNKFVEKTRPKPVAPKASEVEQHAHFIPEIDLHFEKLVKNAKDFLPNEILPAQLDHAEKFLLRAEEMGLSEVYLIHGVGNGRLREALHRMLKKRPRVADFKNELHPKYGAGATWVKLA